MDKVCITIHTDVCGENQPAWDTAYIKRAVFFFDETTDELVTAIQNEWGKLQLLFKGCTPTPSTSSADKRVWTDSALIS
jgi:hypothetical protein